MDIEEFGDETEKDETEKNDSDIPKLEQALRKVCDSEEKAETFERKSYSQWYCISNNIFKPGMESVKVLPGGLYDLDRNERGEILFFKRELKTDELITFPDSNMDQILQEIEVFWTKKEIFSHYGFLHKRGYLFYGPAGSGKTCLVRLIIHNLIDRGGIIIRGACHPDTLRLGTIWFRDIEPEKQIICLFEDIDSIIREYGEERILAFLDGESSIDNVLNIATTNYPEKLDKRIVQRPRRFDRVIKIDMPSESIRQEFFALKLKIKDTELDEYVKLTKGFSFAAMAELVISTKCFDIPLHDAVQRLASLNGEKSSDEYYSRKIGIGGIV